MTRSGLLPADQVHITTDTNTQPFWDAAREHSLVVCQCANCGHMRMPPSAFCPECQSDTKRWPGLSGDGTIFSFSVVHGIPGLPDLILVAIIVELDGAPDARIVSNLVDVEPESVEIGQRVRAEFVAVSDGYELPVFRQLQA